MTSKAIRERSAVPQFLKWSQEMPLATEKQQWSFDLWMNMTPLRYVDVASEFAVENVQTRPENSSLVDTREFGPDEISSGDIFITLSREDDDLGIIDTEPAYYDEEPVDAYGAEEREDQIESGTPEVYAEV
ncbi:hypothetical protein FALCPG4_014965 [Fusarium falciforme]